MKFISKLIRIIASYSPKFNWVVIQTYPRWEESGVVIYESLIKTDIKKIFWLTPEKPHSIPFEVDESRTTFIKRRSLKGVFFYILSKYVFITHGLYAREFPSNQITVNMWHGMPIKKVGLLDGNEGLKTTHTLSTGAYFQRILSESFGVNKSSILNIGLPRNEKLLKYNKGALDKLNIPGNNKFLFWLPTYRKSSTGDIRLDGTDYKNPFHLPGFDVNDFNTFLKEMNITCYFKPHPMAAISYLQDLSNLKMINEEFLEEKGLTLYETVSVSDFIISDISSIIIDYLLLDKPIILSFADKEEYINSRGLNFCDIIEKPPGRVCSNASELKNELQKLISGKDEFSKRRRMYKVRYHGDVDTSSCSQNLLKIIGIC